MKQKNIQKIYNLKAHKSNHISLFTDNKKWFKNVSSVDIPLEQSEFLSLDPKFDISCSEKDIKLEFFLSDIENIISEIPETFIKDLMRAKTTNIIEPRPQT